MVVIAERMLTRDQVGLPKAAFVRACFDNSYEITPALSDTWMPVLAAVDGSVMVL
jgi:predicted O-linked N-acetylglucosamine transferase (SPINDLY family)